VVHAQRPGVRQPGARSPVIRKYMYRARNVTPPILLHPHGPPELTERIYYRSGGRGQGPARADREGILSLRGQGAGARQS
jgi:hypothetical protein